MLRFAVTPVSTLIEIYHGISKYIPCYRFVREMFVIPLGIAGEFPNKSRRNHEGRAEEGIMWYRGGTGEDRKGT